MNFIPDRLKNVQNITGWRRAACFNSLVLCVLTIALTACLISAVKQAGGISKALLFFSGTCDGGSAAQVNVGLHLLLNVVSTAIFASSNFFMQVLNSPSRKEIDDVHSRGSWVGIGVPSVRNAFQVSKFKTYCWVLLLISSVPLHLLFNSMIFQTDQRNSDYVLAIASEGFVEGTSFFLPGASLTPGGLLSGAWGSSDTTDVNLTEYTSFDSTAYRNTSAMATTGAQWQNISINDCYNEYMACEGLKSHRNIIVVVEPLEGWVRDEVWSLLPNLTEIWDPIVPPKENNALWFSAACSMAALYTDDRGVVCRNTCSGALGHQAVDQTYDTWPSKKTNDSSWVIDFFGDQTDLVNHTNMATWTSDDLTYGLAEGVAQLTVSYCLAEPVVRECHVGLSNILLLAVAICVLVKTTTAVIITLVLSQHNQAPLVTLGDAIESFIQKPDPNTIGMCTVGQEDTRTHSLTSHKAIIGGPRKWLAKQYHYYKVVPISVWWSSYLVFALALSVVIYFLDRTLRTRGGSLGQFLESDSNSFVDGPSWTFATAVLAANSPQLLLSFCYLAYNNLFTRMQMAKEWASYSSNYLPLRVTDPKGEQCSTYRLQLPYKYSIPLILCSIFLHWLLSNTIYVFVSEGGYFNQYRFQTSDDASLPEGTSISVGYSIVALLVLLVAGVLLVCVPLALSFRKLPAGSVNVGSNSIAISAACHVSLLSKAAESRPHSSGRDEPASWSSRLGLPQRPRLISPPYSPLTDATKVASDGEQSLTLGSGDEDGVEMSELISPASHASADKEHQPTQEGVYRQISRSRVRWGVVQMPEGFYSEFVVQGRQLDHLSFGVEEDEVATPVYMRHYT